MSGSPPLAFLDANVLFSAAIGGPAFEVLLELARAGAVKLISSRTCVVEAETNLGRKRAGSRQDLDQVLALITVEVHVEADQHSEWAQALVHPDDVHVLAAARRAGADVLVTGDTKHFGRLMERSDLGFRVRTPRAFLLEGQV